jgi:hypothetical protein
MNCLAVLYSPSTTRLPLCFSILFAFRVLKKILGWLVSTEETMPALVHFFCGRHTSPFSVFQSPLPGPRIRVQPTGITNLAPRYPSPVCPFAQNLASAPVYSLSYLTWRPWLLRVPEDEITASCHFTSAIRPTFVAATPSVVVLLSLLKCPNCNVLLDLALP